MKKTRARAKKVASAQPLRALLNDLAARAKELSDDAKRLQTAMRPRAAEKKEREARKLRAQATQIRIAMRAQADLWEAKAKTMIGGPLIGNYGRECRAKGIRDCVADLKSKR